MRGRSDHVGLGPGHRTGASGRVDLLSSEFGKGGWSENPMLEQVDARLLGIVDALEDQRMNRHELWFGRT